MTRRHPFEPPCPKSARVSLNLLRFWDASAVVPALVREPKTEVILSLLREDEGMAFWWTTQVERASFDTAYGIINL